MSNRAEAKFVVCEDVRTETNGKLTLIGVYPGEMIVLNKRPAGAKPHPKWLAVLPRLAFVGFFRGIPKGTLPGHVQLDSPSGETILESDLEDVKFEEARPSTLIVQGGAVGIPELGIYKAKFKFGTFDFDLDVEIKGAHDFEAVLAAPTEGAEQKVGNTKRPKKVARKSSRKGND